MNPSAQYDSRLYTKWAILVLAAITTSYFAKAQMDPLYYTPGEDLAKKTANFLFLKVKTNKKEALVGESISAWYYLYVAVDIQGKLTKSPSFTGFASYDMAGGNADANCQRQARPAGRCQGKTQRKGQRRAFAIGIG